MAEAQSFELLENKRKSLRTAVTKIVNELEAELSNSDLNVDRLSELVETLCIKFEPLTLVDQQMEYLFKPEEFDGEFEIAEKYREKVFFWSFVRKRLTIFQIPMLRRPPYRLHYHKMNIFETLITFALKSQNIISPDSMEMTLQNGFDIAGKLFTGEVKQLSEGLTAVNTRLGLTVMGQLSCEFKFKLESSLLVHSLFTTEKKISDLWELDSLGIKDPSEKKSKLELQDLALKHFENTVLRDEGRYIVSIPWIEGNEKLEDHYSLAKGRLEKTVKTLNFQADYLIMNKYL
ncbi:uncharacterized protein TNCV_5028991 [Trichonephila clavipes]|nr:uncharacterized protein TNCV_5028991 [Trichonephila clavipes]